MYSENCFVGGDNWEANLGPISVKWWFSAERISFGEDCVLLLYVIFLMGTVFWSLRNRELIPPPSLLYVLEILSEVNIIIFRFSQFNVMILKLVFQLFVFIPTLWGIKSTCYFLNYTCLVKTVQFSILVSNKEII